MHIYSNADTHVNMLIKPFIVTKLLSVGFQLSVSCLILQKKVMLEGVEMTPCRYHMDSNLGSCILLST